jgi:hypothetical protein
MVEEEERRWVIATPKGNVVMRRAERSGSIEGVDLLVVIEVRK